METTERKMTEHLKQTDVVSKVSQVCIFFFLKIHILSDRNPYANARCSYFKTIEITFQEYKEKGRHEREKELFEELKKVLDLSSCESVKDIEQGFEKLKASEAEIKEQVVHYQQILANTVRLYLFFTSLRRPQSMKMFGTAGLYLWVIFF